MFFDGAQRALAVAWIGRTRLDPCFEIGNLGIAEFGLRRHLQGGVLQFYCSEQERLGCVSCHERGARVTALEHAGPRIEQQVALLLFVRRMALVTVLHKEGADLGFKMRRVLGADRADAQRQQ